MKGQKLILAGRGSRMGNAIVDTISYLGIWLIVSLVLMFFGLDGTIVDETGDRFPVVPALILVPTFWAYYFISEFYFQQTLGKLLTRTNVVTKAGIKPTACQILGRTLSRSIPFEYVSYFVTVIGIHDRLSGTVVVEIEEPLVNK